MSNVGSNVSTSGERRRSLWDNVRVIQTKRLSSSTNWRRILYRGLVSTRRRRVAAIQRLTLATTALKTVNNNPVDLHDFLKNFHFIRSRFVDTLRQTKSTTFTVVYVYVCVYRRDEAEEREKKTTHVIGSLSSPTAVSTVPQPLASDSSARYQTLLSRTGRWMRRDFNLYVRCRKIQRRL